MVGGRLELSLLLDQVTADALEEVRTAAVRVARSMRLDEAPVAADLGIVLVYFLAREKERADRVEKRRKVPETEEKELPRPSPRQPKRRKPADLAEEMRKMAKIIDGQAKEIRRSSGQVSPGPSVPPVAPAPPPPRPPPRLPPLRSTPDRPPPSAFGERMREKEEQEEDVVGPVSRILRQKLGIRKKK